MSICDCSNAAWIGNWETVFASQLASQCSRRPGVEKQPSSGKNCFIRPPSAAYALSPASPDTPRSPNDLSLSAVVNLPFIFRNGCSSQRREMASRGELPTRLDREEAADPAERRGAAPETPRGQVLTHLLNEDR